MMNFVIRYTLFLIISHLLWMKVPVDLISRFFIYIYIYIYKNRDHPKLVILRGFNFASEDSPKYYYKVLRFEGFWK